jgi:AAA+ ATPase superfamily predicted ATPase
MQGRKKEIEQLDRIVSDSKSHFVAIYGRRRVGKTFLIREYFQNQFCFYHTGIAYVGMRTQLSSFYRSLLNYSNDTISELKDWFDGFDQLKKIITSSTQKKKIVFIDELPWMDTPRSNFLAALEHFWNSWGSARKDLIFIICGSATSYIVKNIFNNKGGLHNRVTAKIKLHPFTLGETKQFLESKGIYWNNYQTVKAYMCIGGIPFYLEALEKGKSVDQNIDELLFNTEGLLHKEFQHLYASLFSNADKYVEVISALATKKQGLSREEILKKVSTSNGGTFSKILEDLELSDFIKRYTPFGKKLRDSLYQLTDFYSLFYYSFIHEKNVTSGDWLSAIDHPKQRAWSGYAFEMVCMSHIEEIKKALGISGVKTEISSWRGFSNTGAQIDLVIDRRDQVINLFEMKYSINEFTITKKYSSELRNKVGVFRDETKTKKSVFLSMLTTYGVKQNEHSGLIQNNITMDALFQ